MSTQASERANLIHDPFAFAGVFDRPRHEIGFRGRSVGRPFDGVAKASRSQQDDEEVLVPFVGRPDDKREGEQRIEEKATAVRPKEVERDPQSLFIILSSNSQQVTKPNDFAFARFRRRPFYSLRFFSASVEQTASTTTTTTHSRSVVKVEAHVSTERARTKVSRTLRPC